MWKKIAVSILGLFMLIGSTSAASATDHPKWVAGDKVVVGAYCNSTDEQLVRDMSDIVTREGGEGYAEWISRDTPCWDARIPEHFAQGVRAVRGILLEKLWTFTSVDGEVIEIWRFADSHKQKGFTWLSPRSVPGDDV